MIRALACLPPALLLLAACSTREGYPSLARRDAELLDETPAAVTTPPSGEPSAELTARLVTLVEQARAADARFGARRSSVERIVGAAGRTGTDSWAAANAALSDLETTRSQATVALAELDQLDARESNTETSNAANVAAVAAAREQVAALVSEQDEVLSRLRARL